MHPQTERWPVAIVALASVALILGAIGADGLNKGCRIDNCRYTSVQLFALEFPGGVTHVPLPLDIARFLAPLVLGYAVALAILAGARFAPVLGSPGNDGTARRRHRRRDRRGPE